MDEDIWEFPNISTKKQRAGWYVPETVQHPAKMPTYLVDKIIEEYTKPGDVILDLMAGCGTTGIEAIKKGRNCILVDYERKFCDMMQKNIDVANKQQTLTPKGKAAVIHGDARNLSPLLGEVDQIVFSPPFANLNKGGGIAVKGYEGEYGKDEKLKDRHARRLSEDPNNIDNIKKYGSVDSIVMSPPYKTATEGSGLYKHPERAPTLRGVCNRPDGLKVSTDPENIGNLKYGSVDGIVTSPPYSKDVVPHTSHRPGHTQDERGYSDDKDNLGNMPYGKVDSVIMSPPYAEIGMSDKSRCFEKPPRPDDIRQSLRKTPIRPYSGNKNNIGNLKYGKVDSVIMSPPYEGQLSGIKLNWDKQIERMVKAGKTKNLKRFYGEQNVMRSHRGAYSDSKDNIGNLKGQTYLEAMHQVYAECFKVLKQGGYMVLVVKNFIRNKKIVDLAGDTVKLCESVGFRHVRTHKRKLTQLSFWIINYRKRYPDAPRVDHEHVLVFQKV